MYRYIIIWTYNSQQMCSWAEFGANFTLEPRICGELTVVLVEILCSWNGHFHGRRVEENHDMNPGFAQVEGRRKESGPNWKCFSAGCTVTCRYFSPVWFIISQSLLDWLFGNVTLYFHTHRHPVTIIDCNKLYMYPNLKKKSTVVYSPHYYVQAFGYLPPLQMISHEMAASDSLAWLGMMNPWQS